MIRVYFDRNVWQDIFETGGGITAVDVKSLRDAVRHGKVGCIVSMTTLEETLAMAESRPLRALAEIQFIIGLAGQSKNIRKARLVKEAGDLLDDDIRAYARNEQTPGRYVFHDLSPMQGALMRNDRRLDEFFKTVREQKEAFYRYTQRLRQHLASPESGRIELVEDARRSFGEYFQTHAAWFARSLADHAGVLNSAENRGIDGLLDLPSVRMAVGANLSLVYAQIFENRAPDRGDSRDVHHAIAASVADVFVTNDTRLAPRLARIPKLPVEVLDLPMFLGRISTGQAGGALVR